MPKNPDPHIKKRQRNQPSHRWTLLETESLLDLIMEAVKENPECFEKPTSQRFFEGLAAKSPLLKKIDWVCMKSKMRYLKGTYLSAVDWQGQTDASYLETGEEECLIENANKLCPFFEQLQQIFGVRTNLVPNVSYQSSYYTDDIIKEDPNLYTVPGSFQEDEQLKLSPPSVSQPKDQPKLPNKKCNKTSNFKSNGQIMSLEEKKFELEVRRFEEEMELKKIKQTQDFELRKLEMEKDERIRRYEIELKYKNKDQ